MTAPMYYPCKRVMTLPNIRMALDKLNVPREQQREILAEAAINQSAAIVIPHGDDSSAVAIIQFGDLEGVTGAHVLLGFMGAMEATEAAAIANWPDGEREPIYAIEYRPTAWGTA